MKKLVASVVFAALSMGTPRSGDAVVVHEWGTFTSVAGNDGNPVLWAPLAGTPDLPCFVERLIRGVSKADYAAALVRMETPVLYFYSATPATISVRVDFPQGWFTEWFPHATATGSDGLYKNGRIEWNSIKLTPGDDLLFPTTKGPSRYYAARATDATPLQIEQDHEKMIFYRGIGNFAPPLRPRFNGDGKLEISNAHADPIPLAILFENRGGKAGYRVARGIQSSITLEPPEITGSIDQLRQDLTNILMEFGLYEKEARAMIETWHDSWFEEGMRVFYIVPRGQVDALLPLTIAPAPSAISRVFVGRVEVLSPWMRQTIESALTMHDNGVLAKFGRFVEPFATQMGLRISNIPTASNETCIP